MVMREEGSRGRALVMRGGRQREGIGDERRAAEGGHW